MEYEQLLEEAYEKIKPIEANKDFDRWEIPQADISISGNKTTILNFAQICSALRRKQEHLSKFLSKELASYSKIEGDKLVINRKLSKEIINEKIQLYIAKYVVCLECKKPDTEIVKEGGFLFVHCLACGAKHSLGRV